MQLDMYPYTTHCKQSKSGSVDYHGVCSYQLLSVVVHKGKIDSGHYVAYAREGSEWFLFDDSKVVLVTEADVLHANAYLLFYVSSSFEE